MELRIPPPLVALIFGLVMWCLSKATVLRPLDVGLTEPLSLTVLVLGVLTNIIAVVSFRRARTTVNPMKPESATQLVSSGVYGLSRNPMYLGLLLIVLSWVIWLGNLLNIAVLFLFIWYMTVFQIIPEERALENVFPEAFKQYRSRVRRWI